MANKALLVGINDYQGISDLRGCINDVTNMRHTLRTYFGFSNNEIRALVDRRANRGNILYRLNWLVDKANAGDFLVFHFSGHGSQIRDRDGDELQDRMDELICPYDMNWDDGFITDDDLKKVFDKLPEGVQLEVFLDCCHSGTGTRNVGLERPPELGPEHPTLARFLPPPVDIESRSEGEEHELEATRGFQSPKRSTLNHVLWAGCAADQTSADAHIGGDYNGAFTYYFCKHMRAVEGRIRRSDLLQRVRASLKHNEYWQVPQLEGPSNFRRANTLSYKK